MGRLTLEVIEARALDDPGDAVSVVARWRLEYPEDGSRETAEGLTLIVLNRKEGRWQIVHDASM